MDCFVREFHAPFSTQNKVWVKTSAMESFSIGTNLLRIISQELKMPEQFPLALQVEVSVRFSDHRA